MSSTKSFTAGIVAVLALAAVSIRPVTGQAIYGSVVGTVADQSGAKVRNVAVTLTNVGTGERHQTHSGQAGDYEFLNLVPGMYRVEGSKAVSRKPR